MRIQSVEISKFRSIEYGWFEFDSILGIVGQNNSGKSAILKALNCFFNPDKELPRFIDGTHLYSTNRAVPRITVKFVNVTPNQAYNGFEVNQELKVKIEFNKQRNRLEYHSWVEGRSIQVSDEFKRKLLEDVQFVLIPADRNTRTSKESQESVLQTLLDSFFSIHTAKRDNLSPKVRTAFNYFKRNALNKVSSGIEAKYLTSNGFKIQIDSKTDITYDLFINDLSIMIHEGERDFELEECGSGVQSLVAISIYRYLAELDHSNFIIAVEEPEVNLHPQGQKELIYALLSEAEQGNVQILFTTHSTVILDQLDHTGIVLVRKVPDDRRVFKTKLLQLRTDFWGYYGIQRLQYDKFHRFRNSEFFFANHVLVTESDADSEVFRVLMDSKGVVFERDGISILELGGIDSLKYAFYLLRDLEIPKTIVIDKDFFFAYQNGTKEASRYRNGFFNYTGQYKEEPLIAEIIVSEQDRNRLEGLLTANHSRALDLTIKYDVICMKYNLEMDLLASRVAKELMYNRLRVPVEDRTQLTLLTNYSGAIKKIRNLNHVVKQLPHQNLPNSYKRLVGRLKEVKN